MDVQGNAGSAGMTKYAFRVDASLQMGTGHVMRCLTLAAALSRKGGQCHFLCREHCGNLIDLIRDRGHIVHALPPVTGEWAEPDAPVHSAWLGTSQYVDAQQCMSIMARLRPDWLIVDHYALDCRWESTLRPYARRVMAIDDLADRNHDVDLLLDQTFGREEKDYDGSVPAGCELLCGSRFSLLRPEFSAFRPESLARRSERHLRRVLITMGGVDNADATGRVLDVLRGCTLPSDCEIVVVMGASAPWLATVTEKAQGMPWPTSVLVNVSDMGRLMTSSDLAIGAAGATSWERCCLGLPTIMVVLAENQKLIASNLESAGAALVIDDVSKVEAFLPLHVEALMGSSERLKNMSLAASKITDGAGVEVVEKRMELGQ